MSMVQVEKINEIAQELAAANLTSQAIENVISEPTIDSEGREALRITIVIKPNKVSNFSGEKILDTLYQIQIRLLQEGEERPAIVEYATKEELEQSGDARS
jgi:hypothetical protein